MTKAMKSSVREISKQYVMKQLEHVGSSPRIRQQDLNRAIDKVSKALLEVKAAQRVAAKR
jgi:flavin-binding protein dodecin